MLANHLRKPVLILLLAFTFATAAWCGRTDKPGSNYGVTTEPCSSPSGPSSGLFGDITVSCFTAQSDGTTTLFEINSLGIAPSTIKVYATLPDGVPADPSDLDFGLLTCDSSGATIPCVASTNHVNFASDTPSLTPGTPLFTFTDFNAGNVDFYITQHAVITNVTGSSTVPEPRYLAWAGFLLALLIGFARRIRSLRPAAALVGR